MNHSVLTRQYSNFVVMLTMYLFLTLTSGCSRDQKSSELRAGNIDTPKEKPAKIIPNIAFPLDASSDAVYYVENLYHSSELRTYSRLNGTIDSVDYRYRIVSLYLDQDILLLASADTLIMQQFSTGKTLGVYACPFEVHYVAIDVSLTEFVIGNRSMHPPGLYYYKSGEFVPAFKYYYPESNDLKIISKYIEDTNIYLLDDSDNWSCIIYEYSLESGKLSPVISEFDHDGWPADLGNGKFYIQDKVPIDGVIKDGSSKNYIVDIIGNNYSDITYILSSGINRCDPIVLMSSKSEIFVPCQDNQNFIDLTKLTTIEYSNSAPFRINHK